MKTLSEPGTIGAPIIIRNPKLNREDNAALFSEKMEKAREIIARAGLPPVNRQKSIKNQCESNNFMKLDKWFYEVI